MQYAHPRHLAAVLFMLAAASPAAHAEETPAANTVLGSHTEYHPALAFEAGGTLLVPTATLATRIEAVEGFAVDADGARLDGGANVDLLARVGLMFTSYDAVAPLLLGADLELDAFAGLVTDGPDVEGDGHPNSGGSDTLVVRKAFATLSWKGLITLRGGFMTSQWGLGLIANDGAQWWQPASADFTDPRGGDRVLRGQIIARTAGESFIAASVAVDDVVSDDALRDGDDALQIVAAVLGQTPNFKGGAYVVRRFQDAADGDEIDVWVADLHAEYRHELSATTSLLLATEWAVIFGTTTLAGSADFPEHDVLQVGGVVRVGLDAGSVGGVLDVFYASGDQNVDDDAQNAFKADPNFSMGMFLFPYVMAGHSARSAHNALAPDLVGHPPGDLDRLPTRGSASNTIALFPRIFVRPVAGLEIYGGPLFAFADVAPTDPLNSRLAGGETRNAYDVKPGAYLGTELDLGVRYRLIAEGTELTVGVEGGALLPGSAIDAPGNDLGAILGGRFMLTYRL